MPRKVVTAVTAFIDWNSQIHAARPGRVDPIQLAERTLSYVGRTIGKALTSISAAGRYDVTLRVYHGWRRGFELTVNRRALISVAAGADFVGLSRRSNVLIRDRVQFGDLLISASEGRFHHALTCHLPNTYRPSVRHPAELEEKMVDTALASDLVDMAHREPSALLLVLGDDDDLVPPVFVAEAARTGVGERVMLIRTRPQTVFLKLEGVQYRP